MEFFKKHLLSRSWWLVVIGITVWFMMAPISIYGTVVKCAAALGIAYIVTDGAKDVVRILKGKKE